MGSGVPGGGPGGQPGAPKAPNWVSFLMFFGTGQNRKSYEKLSNFHRNGSIRYQNVEEDMTEPMAGSLGPGGPN